MLDLLNRILAWTLVDLRVWKNEPPSATRYSHVDLVLLSHVVEAAQTLQWTEQTPEHLEEQADLLHDLLRSQHFLSKADRAEHARNRLDASGVSIYLLAAYRTALCTLEQPLDTSPALQLRAACDRMSARYDASLEVPSPLLLERDELTNILVSSAFSAKDDEGASLTHREVAGLIHLLGHAAHMSCFPNAGSREEEAKLSLEDAFTLDTERFYLYTHNIMILTCYGAIRSGPLNLPTLDVELGFILSFAKRLLTQHDPYTTYFGPNGLEILGEALVVLYQIQRHQPQHPLLADLPSLREKLLARMGTGETYFSKLVPRNPDSPKYLHALILGFGALAQGDANGLQAYPIPPALEAQVARVTQVGFQMADEVREWTHDICRLPPDLRVDVYDSAPSAPVFTGALSCPAPAPAPSPIVTEEQQGSERWVAEIQLVRRRIPPPPPSPSSNASTEEKRAHERLLTEWSPKPGDIPILWPQFEVRWSPGRGLGVFALQSIPARTAIPYWALVKKANEVEVGAHTLYVNRNQALDADPTRLMQSGFPHGLALGSYINAVYKGNAKGNCHMVSRGSYFVVNKEKDIPAGDELILDTYGAGYDWGDKPKRRVQGVQGARFEPPEPRMVDEEPNQEERKIRPRRTINSLGPTQSVQVARRVEKVNVQAGNVTDITLLRTGMDPVHGFTFTNPFFHDITDIEGLPLPKETHAPSPVKTYTVEVRWHEDRGWGVFAVTPIPAGSYLEDYRGLLFSSREATLRRNTDYQWKVVYTWHEGKVAHHVTTVIDPFPVPPTDLCGPVPLLWGIGRYINHSRTRDNLFLKEVVRDFQTWVDKTRHVEIRVQFWTARDIEAGEELRYDYGQPQDEVIPPAWLIQDPLPLTAAEAARQATRINLGFTTADVHRYIRVVEHLVEVKQTTDGRGWGVFALQPLAKHTYIGTYMGEYLDDEKELRRREQIYDAEGVGLYIHTFTHRQKTYFIDGTRVPSDSRFSGPPPLAWGYTRYINHSTARANTEWVGFKNTPDWRQVHIEVQTTREIREGEELLISYRGRVPNEESSYLNQ